MQMFLNLKKTPWGGKYTVSNASTGFKYSISPFYFPVFSEKIFYTQINFQVSEINESDFLYHQITLPPDFSKMIAKRRCEFLAGRICAQLSLKQFGLIQCANVGMAADRSPVWPEGIVGSITHTSSTAAACIASSDIYKNIGIDIEVIFNDETANSIKSEVTRYPELNVLKDEALSETLLITLIFSAKESIFKAIYNDVGYIFGFDCVSLIELNQYDMLFTLTTSLSPEWQVGDRVRVAYRIVDGYVYTSMVVAKTS
jgi:enterobactin synthetase component D